MPIEIAPAFERPAPQPYPPQSAPLPATEKLNVRAYPLQGFGPAAGITEPDLVEERPYASPLRRADAARASIHISLAPSDSAARQSGSMK